MWRIGFSCYCWIGRGAKIYSTAQKDRPTSPSCEWAAFSPPEVARKGSKLRVVFLDQYLVEILRPIVNRCSPNQSLLLNHQGAPISSPRRVNDIVTCLAARAGIADKKVTPHTLRHTFATILVEEIGFSLPMVQQLLGHSRIDETMRYIHPDHVRLREGVERLGRLYASTEEQIISEWVKGELCSR